MNNLSQNASTTDFLTSRTELEHLLQAKNRRNVILKCQDGTGSAGMLEIEWQTHVFPCFLAVQIKQAGSVEVTLQWLMGLFKVKFVFLGQVAVVIRRFTSLSVTVEDFTFTS